MKKLKGIANRVLFALVAMMAATPIFALAPPVEGSSDIGNVDVAEIGNLAATLHAWLSGDLGLLIIMVGIIVAVIMVIARASLMPVLFVLGLAIFMGWGPALFAGILGAEITPAMLATIA